MPQTKVYYGGCDQGTDSHRFGIEAHAFDPKNDEIGLRGCVHARPHSDLFIFSTFPTLVQVFNCTKPNSLGYMWKNKANLKFI